MDIVILTEVVVNFNRVCESFKNSSKLIEKGKLTLDECHELLMLLREGKEACSALLNRDLQDVIRFLENNFEQSIADTQNDIEAQT